MDREYFILVYENNEQYPRLDWDEREYELRSLKIDREIFYQAEPILCDFPLYLTVAHPCTEHPEFVDFHMAINPVVSKQFVESLTPLFPYGLQFFNAQVRQIEGHILQDHFLMHIYNEICCVDRRRTQLEVSRSGMLFLENLRLNINSLEQIELSKRLVFVLEEDTSLILMHQILVERLLPLNLKGVRFVPVLDWHSGSLFDK